MRALVIIRSKQSLSIFFREGILFHDNGPPRLQITRTRGQPSRLEDTLNFLFFDLYTRLQNLDTASRSNNSKKIYSVPFCTGNAAYASGLVCSSTPLCMRKLRIQFPFWRFSAAPPSIWDSNSVIFSA